MKKAILIFMVFALLVTSSIAEGHEEVLFLMNMINESCLGSLSVERTAGWELVEKSKTDEMYIYSVFEEFEKTDYIFNFWKSDDGQFVTGFVAFMLLKEDELVGGWLPQFYH